MLYELNAINFDLIIYNVINKERRLFVIKKNNIIIFVYGNNKNK